MAEMSTKNEALPSQPTIHVGVLLLPEGSQLLDLSAVDLFGMLEKSYLQACQLPAPLIAQALDRVEINYISSVPAGTPIPLTAKAVLTSTADLNSSSVAPGVLDVLMIPGPDPAVTVSEEVCHFVRSHAESSKTSILVICTGQFIAGAAGILDHKHVTGPRGLLPTLRNKFPDAKWEDSRWEQDGRIWCSGGITNGLDMTAAFLRQRWPGVLSDTVCALADVGDRGKKYHSGQAAETSWWLWLIMRSWIRGFTK